MGAGAFDLTQTTAPTWATGKTAAQALNAGAFKWTAAQTASILNNEEFSYACWFYVDAASGTSASDYKKIFGAEGGTNSSNRRFTCGQYPTVNGFHVSSWNGSSLISCCRIDDALPSYQWTHICYSYKKGAINIYINGVLRKTTELTMNNSSYSAETPVIWNYTGRRLQDVRVYDHALSQKEVAELAKGLIIHYTLDNPYTTGVLNFYSGANAQGDSSSSSFTKTKLVGEDGYNFKLTRTGTGGNSWPNITFPGISRTNFTAGKKYTWSAKVRCHKWTSGSFDLRNSIASNDYTNGSVQVCSTALADGQWHQYSRTITLTEGMKIGSTFYYLTTEAYNASTETSKAYMSPRVEFYSSNQNTEGTVYDMDFDIKEVQLIESDSFPGWVDNTMASNTVRDNTGRGNDATCSGSVTTEGGSPRNTRAFKFISGAGACLWPVPDPIKSTTTEFTISVWFKTTTVSGNQCIWNGRTTTGAAVGIFLKDRGIRVDDSNQTTSATISANTWYHLAVTWKSGGNKVIYLNGEQKTSVAAGTLSKSNTKASIGRSSSGDVLSSDNYFSGQMSDFRIYATALTSEQIKELYNAPISVADTGACISGQFTEGAAGISFAKTGVVSCNGISSLPGKYDSEVLIEPDGSCWVHIGHHADPTTYKFSSGDPFATGVWKDGRRFLDASYCNLVDKWEFIVTQRATATATEQRFRWVQTKNPNVAVYEDVVASAVTKYTAADGYTDMNASHGGIYKFNSNTYYVMTNGTKGNWFGAIGAWNAWNGGIPGINSTAVKDGGHLDLYIRIDNVTFTSSRTGCSLDKGGNGVLSPEFVEQ